MVASGSKLSCPCGIQNENHKEMIIRKLSLKQILKLWLPMVANFLALWKWDLFGMMIVVR